MAIDWNEGSEQKEPKIKQQQFGTALAALCADLDETLNNPDPSMTLLQQQAVILDELLLAVMKHSLIGDKSRGYFSKDNIDLVLRIQKQSAETIKISTTADYMSSLVTHRARPAM